MQLNFCYRNNVISSLSQKSNIVLFSIYDPDYLDLVPPGCENYHHFRENPNFIY